MYHEIVAAGILLALFYYELTHLSPGGLVTPAYCALCLTSPLRIAYTAVLVTVTWLILRGLSAVWIVYGKRRFALAVVITFLLDWLLGGLGIFSFGIRAIGYIVPALLVRDLEKQGFKRTGLSLGVVTGLLALLMLWFGVL